MNFNAENILIINFGQIGDVILSLPALQAIKNKFAHAKITLLIGKSARAIVEMSGLADQILVVDRVELRDGNKLKSISKILSLISEIRSKKFDFVIDLHSLTETNLLGYLSGAKIRHFANRGNRSLDFLSNFRPKSPKLDPNLHATDNYLNSLTPLGIGNAERSFHIETKQDDQKVFKQMLKTDNIEGLGLVGINIGAGNPTRCWDIAKFSELSKRFDQNGKSKVLVFFGPEENHLEDEIRRCVSPNAIIYNKLSLGELAAAFTHLKLLIGNDTGPMHLGALVGTQVLIINNPAQFLPIGDKVNFVMDDTNPWPSVDQVFAKTQSLL